MDQKLDTSNYIFPNQNHSNQGQSSSQNQTIRHQDSRMPYLKTEASEGGLGSPINHPSFQQYKGQPNMQRPEFPNHAEFTPQQQSHNIQNYNQQMQLHFELQRQYMAGNMENSQVYPDQSGGNLSQVYNMSSPFQSRSNNNDASAHMNAMQPRPVEADAGMLNSKSPIPSRAATPVENITGMQEAPSSGRKRYRKSDHAVPGDEGDNELKQLAFKASQLPLSELALRIKSVENDDSIPETKTSYSTSKDTSKERQRQIFGMVWLLNSCESSATAVVPRNRIYARYVQICADNSLKPLSPASFGKLVRILFPNLTTRRLGMRGQSKYHYCGIKLVGDQNIQAGNSPTSASPSIGNDSPQSFQNPNTPSVSNSPIISGVSASNSSAALNSILSNGEFLVNDLKHIPNLFGLIDQSLNGENLNSPLNLPSIYPYLPRDTDYDIADTLYSLYKVHCTSVFEFLRYMQVRKLFSSFASFNGILTAPVFKLYTNDLISEWVNECDNIMYKTMAKMLTKLHLQSVPDDVLRQLKQISNQYVDKLSYSLQNKVPKFFMAMKMKNAKKFIMILSRLIKVIETGYSASRILNSAPEKQAMIDDWLKLDVNEIVLREVPCSKENVESLLHVLNNDLLTILHEQVDTESVSVLTKSAHFLAELPSKFSKLNPRLFTLVSSNFLTTCLREISLNGGQGFGTWWIVRCWVDEYLSWCFELGGYFQDDFTTSFNEAYVTDRDTNVLKAEKTNPKADSSANNTNTSMGQFDDSTNDQLRLSSIVDLLDGAYGTDSVKDDQNNNEMMLNYDSVGVENFLGRNDDLLS